MEDLHGSELDRQVAEKVFGWKWLSWIGIPVHSAPNYPVQCRIRSFVSPETRANSDWIWFWEGRDVRAATGNEPLAYRYCSSQPGELPPCYHGCDDIKVLEEVRTKWTRKRVDLFLVELARIWGERGKPYSTAWMAWALYERGDYSRAALTVLEE